MNPQTLRTNLRSVSAYQGLTRLPLMKDVLTLLDALRERDIECAIDAYAGLFCALRREGFRSLGDWLTEHLRYDEAPYPLLVERDGYDRELEEAARRDVETLSLLAGQDLRRDLEKLDKRMEGDYAQTISNLPRWETAALPPFRELTQFYRTHGAGQFARYRAFLWERGELVPVADPDCGSQDELIGYELQRGEVIENTRALLEGRECNNVLLYGTGGTGKSATVKSLLTVPGFEQLRLIEVDKDDLAGLNRLIRSLAGRRQKFILFIDDLAFDRDDQTYSALKTNLEGGLEKRPANVAVYATSNRRRLVRQTVSDRDGDEMDARETVDEKTALSDRFGLRVAYLPLDKAGYLSLVEQLAERKGIVMEREALHKAALQWELSHPGRTPRTARQFLAGMGV